MNDLQKSVIIALADNDMGVERAAKAMHYHHNTVMYHIENIYKKTGLNPRCFFDLAKLYEMATGESIMEKMTTKEAIAYLQPIADNTSLSGYQAALKVAMEAMRERDKQCITRADRIRAMSDDELAWELMVWRIDAYSKAMGDESVLPCTKKSVCEWLQQPIVEDKQ